MGAIVVGSPKSVADQLQAWVEETDIDGFNLAYAVTPESFADFVELIVPELQRRGVYKLDYRPGTLREKLFGQGRARLPENHPAATYGVQVDVRRGAIAYGGDWSERRQRQVIERGCAVDPIRPPSVSG